MVAMDSIKQRGASILRNISWFLNSDAQRPTKGVKHRYSVTSTFHNQIYVDTSTTMGCSGHESSSYPVVLIDVHSTVDEHLNYVCVSLTAGQRQRTFPSFGQQVWVGPLQPSERERENECFQSRFNNRYVLRSVPPYVLQQKLDDGDLSVRRGPHQRGETFVVLEVDYGLCAKKYTWD